MASEIDKVAKEIYESVVENRHYKWHNDIVVVGENATGKTTLLKRILSLASPQSTDYFYFIDSLNRVVSGHEVRDQVSNICYADYKPQQVFLDRMDDSSFSKEDIFVSGITGAQITYSELAQNLEEYESLFNNFFPCKLAIDNILSVDSFIGGTKTIMVNDTDINSLSSGEAARIRLIMEIQYAAKNGCRLVIIDEFDNHFETDFFVQFIEQLKKCFKGLRFLFVIHNFEALTRLSETDGIIFCYPQTSPIILTVVDCDDITEIGQIEKIRARYITRKDSDELFLASCVTSCVKIGSLSSEQKQELLKMERNALNSKKRILYDYVKGYIKDENSDTN